MANNGDALVFALLANQLPRIVWAGIVNHINALYLRSDPGKDVENV
jgi:hypothetical protein